MIQLKQLDETNRPQFEQLLREMWNQNWCDEVAQQIVHWRYYTRPAGGVTWLAMKQGRCVGMLDSMLRPYMLYGKRVLIRETADWYCTPEQRPYGVGLWLLRQAAGAPEPVFVLGGSVNTLQILPKLRWRVLPSANGYVLPVKARGLVGNIIRHKWWQHEGKARLIPRFLPGKAPRRIAPPTGRRAQVRVMEASDKLDVLPANGHDHGYGLVQLFEPQHWDWMVRMPTSVARPVGMTFYLDDTPVGFSLSQIEPTAAGLDAKIVHLQCDSDNAVGWVISETTRTLADLNVDFLRCCVSTPAKIAAIEQVGWIKTRDVPCHWSPGKSTTIPNSIDVGYLRGDDAMPWDALRGRQLTESAHV